MEWVYDVDLWILGFCSLVGSLKASIEVDKKKPCFTRAIDVLLGVICGMAVVHHYATDFNIGLSALVALAGGAGGAMIVEVFLNTLPTIAKDIIEKRLKNLFK